MKYEFIRKPPGDPQTVFDAARLHPIDKPHWAYRSFLRMHDLMWCILVGIAISRLSKAFASDHYYWFSVALGLTLLYLFLRLRFFVSEKLYMARLRSSPQFQSDHHYQFDEKGFQMGTASHYYQVRWDAVTRITQTRNAIAIFTHDLTHVLPNSAEPQENRASLMNDIETWVQAASSGMESIKVQRFEPK